MLGPIREHDMSDPSRQQTVDNARPHVSRQVTPHDLVMNGLSPSEIRTRNLLIPVLQPANQEIMSSHLAPGTRTSPSRGTRRRIARSV